MFSRFMQIYAQIYNEVQFLCTLKQLMIISVKFVLTKKMHFTHYLILTWNNVRIITFLDWVHETKLRMNILKKIDKILKQNVVSVKYDNEWSGERLNIYTLHSKYKIFWWTELSLSYILIRRKL